MEKPFNIKLFFAIYCPLFLMVLGYILYSRYQKNNYVCEIEDISYIDKDNLYEFYKINSSDLYVRDLKYDTVTVYGERGKQYLQIFIVCPISSKMETKTTTFYTAEDMWMMRQNQDYSYVEKFGPTYAWFGFTFEAEIVADSSVNSIEMDKSILVQAAISAYSSMVASDSNKYFTREKDSYLLGVYHEMIADSTGNIPLILKHTYNPYETPPTPFSILSLFK